MDVTTLMRMPIASRTTILENSAHKTGLQTAPGPRTEVEVLEPLVRRLLDEPVENPELLPRQLWAYAFKAPTLLLRLLRQFHPQLLQLDRPLRVLLVGASPHDVLDEGRWYGLTWLLNGFAHMPEIVAVGPELAKGLKSSGIADYVADVPVLLSVADTNMQEMGTPAGQCVDWDAHFDVAVMFHPGFVAHHTDWGTDAAFHDLAAFAEIPIVGTSFDATDFEFDKQGLAMFGRQVQGAFWNPAAHINPSVGTEAAQNPFGTRLQWGGVLWSSERDPAVRQNNTTTAQNRAMEWFRRWLAILDGAPAYDALQFWEFTCPMQFDAVHEYLVVTDRLRIHCRTGEVEAFDHRLPPGPVALELLATPTLTARLARLPAVMEEVWGQLQARGLALEA